MAAYTPTVWVNNTSPPLSAANLDKLTNELESQAAALSISHSLPDWTDNAAPALTDAAPLNEMERVLMAVATIQGLPYTKTIWENGWTPARNAARFNQMELQAQANRSSIDNPPAGPLLLNVDYAENNLSDWWTTGPAYTTSANYSTGNNSYSLVSRNGVICAQHTINSGGNRSEFANYFNDFVLGVHRYFGLQFEVPANLDWNACGNWGTALAQFEQTNGVAAAPILVVLGGTDWENSSMYQGLHLTVQTGTMLNWPNDAGCEFSDGPYGNLPHTWIIPPGQVPLGQRIQVIVHTLRTGETSPPYTGYMEAWWKTYGSSTWNHSTGGTNGTGILSAIPTMQHPPGLPVEDHPAYPTCIVQKSGAYRNAVNYQLVVWQYRVLVGDNFQAVASRLP